jgi:poly(3-hydroxyoctanoate) depolymerase
MADTDAPVQEQRGLKVHVDGVDICVDIRGAGLPLLLISGIGGHIRMWDPLLEELSGVQSITFDLLGSGGSSTPRRPRTMAGLARMVVGMLESLGYERVDVLGVSLGGGLAQQLARQAPDRVRRLVLAATCWGLGMVPGRPWALSLMATPLRYYSRTFFELTAPVYLGGEKWKDRNFVREHGRTRIARPPSLAGYYLQAFAAMTWTSLPWLHTLKQPTLVISGDDDPIVPPINGRLLANRIPGARHHLVRGGGHLFMLDSPEEVAPLISDFLMTEGEQDG